MKYSDEQARKAIDQLTGPEGDMFETIDLGSEMTTAAASMNNPPTRALVLLRVAGAAMREFLEEAKDQMDDRHNEILYDSFKGVESEFDALIKLQMEKMVAGGRNIEECGCFDCRRREQLENAELN